jgi:hypothetical protein
MMAKDSDLNRALQIFQEFGPNRAIPLQKRWKNAFPNETAEQLQMWERLFRELEEFAYGVAEQVLSGETGDSEAAAMISRRFPLMSRERVLRTLSQALYFASK